MFYFYLLICNLQLLFLSHTHNNYIIGSLFIFHLFIFHLFIFHLTSNTAFTTIISLNAMYSAYYRKKFRCIVSFKCVVSRCFSFHRLPRFFVDSCSIFSLPCSCPCSFSIFFPDGSFFTTISISKCSSTIR